MTTPAAGTADEVTPPHAAAAEPDEEVGGDPACWAHRVCQACGRLNAAERPVECEACGEPFDS